MNCTLYAIYAIIRSMRLSLFPAFFDTPANIRFADQEEDEHIELFLRQHGITNVGWILVAIILLGLPLVVNGFFADLVFNQFITVPQNIVIAVNILWLLLVMVYVIQRFLHWYFNIYIVTNQHLVDMDLPNLLHRYTTEVQLNDVESTRAVMQGFFKSFFNYGDLIVETAAEMQNITFAKIPKPDFVKERIQDLQEVQEGIDNAP